MRRSGCCLRTTGHTLSPKAGPCDEAPDVREEAFVEEAVAVEKGMYKVGDYATASEVEVEEKIISPVDRVFDRATRENRPRSRRSSMSGRQSRQEGATPKSGSK